MLSNRSVTMLSSNPSNMIIQDENATSIIQEHQMSSHNSCKKMTGALLSSSMDMNNTSTILHKTPTTHTKTNNNHKSRKVFGDISNKRHNVPTINATTTTTNGKEDGLGKIRMIATTTTTPYEKECSKSIIQTTTTTKRNAVRFTSLNSAITSSSSLLLMNEPPVTKSIIKKKPSLLLHNATTTSSSSITGTNDENHGTVTVDNTNMDEDDDNMYDEIEKPFGRTYQQQWEHGDHNDDDDDDVLSLNEDDLNQMKQTWNEIWNPTNKKKNMTTLQVKEEDENQFSLQHYMDQLDQDVEVVKEEEDDNHHPNNDLVSFLEELENDKEEDDPWFMTTTTNLDISFG